jgi:hypothetical protein
MYIEEILDVTAPTENTKNVLANKFPSTVCQHKNKGDAPWFWLFGKFFVNPEHELIEREPYEGLVAQYHHFARIQRYMKWAKQANDVAEPISTSYTIPINMILHRRFSQMVLPRKVANKYRHKPGQETSDTMSIHVFYSRHVPFAVFE